jgi:hypothetical protein
MMAETAPNHANQKTFTHSLKRILRSLCHDVQNDRGKPGGECTNLRRQASAAEIAREGSSRLFRLDPLRLPGSLTASDATADGGCREVAISRDGVEVRRSIRRVNMRVKIAFQEYTGIAVRVLALGGHDPQIYLTLDHRDEALSVLLGVFEDSVDAAIVARQWSRLTARPVLIADGDGRLRPPATARKSGGVRPRRKRRSGLRNRRVTVRARYQRSSRFTEQKIHQDEREIIARS